MLRTAFVLTPVLFLGSAFGQASKPKDLCAPPPASAAPSLPAKLMTGQGKVRFAITTSNPKAQEFFDQGVNQMHSFWAFEAERSFLQAAALDPEAPMPQWGIAMVAAGDFRPRFQLDRDTPPKKAAPVRLEPAGGLKRAIEAARKAAALAEVPGKATAVEKMYVASIAARRTAKGEAADEGYIKGLRAITAERPDDVEAASYLALHLMRGFTTPEKNPRPGSMEAVEILKSLVAKYPDHPGVHHYIIHAFEGSTFAKDAWTSCRRYPELVDNIPHALHMPGHIWAQTGKWDEAVKSFADASNNELGYIKADKLYSTGHHGHNVHFLVMSYSFRGDYAEAVQAAEGLLAFKENPRDAAAVDNFYSTYRQGWFALMRTLVQNEKWDEILGGKLPAYEKPREQAWRHWARALALNARGDRAGAEKEAKDMDAALRDFRKKTKGPVAAQLAVARMELAGQMTLARKNTGKGLQMLQAAATKELALRYTEPTAYPRPVLEVLGAAALAAGKFETAETAFRGALNQYPESGRARIGLAEALKRGGKPVNAGS
jgi:tetratricopeptide (TPR) repeat protein